MKIVVYTLFLCCACSADVFTSSDSGDPPDAATDAPILSEQKDGGDASSDVSTTLDTGITADAQSDVTDASATTEKHVFVTTASYTGGFGSLGQADSVCQTVATTAQVQGTYKAWLSSSLASPKTRFTHGLAAYKLMDGTLIANSYADLTSGSLHHAINEDVTGTVILNDPSLTVWTNTLPSGDFDTSQAACSDWTTGSQTSYATVGSGDYFVQVSWTKFTSFDCSQPAAFYCFEQ